MTNRSGGSPASRAPRAPGALAGALLLLSGMGFGCAPAETGISESRLQSELMALQERLTTGLHEQMVSAQYRHASLWFAGEAENWPLADYMLHELEELVEEIEETNPVYREVPVAELLGEMTHPALEALEQAVDRGDLGAFVTAYDQLTTACNACHIASDRGAIEVQRPTHPPSTNLRYAPR